jgi:uncharacterized paraquat-inducible protein A
MSDLVDSLRAVLGRRGASDDGHRNPPTSSSSTTLYSCDDCETTYISEELQTCPRCDEPVESTPDEYELGIGPETPPSSRTSYR